MAGLWSAKGSQFKGLHLQILGAGAKEQPKKDTLESHWIGTVDMDHEEIT